MEKYYYNVQESQKSQESRLLKQRIVSYLFIPEYDFSDYHINFIQENNLEVIQCIEEFNSSKKNNFNLAIVKNKTTNLYGVFLYSKLKYKCIISIDFDYIEFNYYCGFTIKKNKLCGLCSSTGAIIVPINFDSVLIKEDLIIASKGKLKELYFLSGKLVLSDNFSNITIEGNLIIVEENEHFYKGLYSKSLSKFILPIKYNKIQILSDCIVAITWINSYKSEESFYDFEGNFIKSQMKSKPIEYDKSDILEGMYMGWW